jgi:hypothetical protein
MTACVRLFFTLFGALRLLFSACIDGRCLFRLGLTVFSVPVSTDMPISTCLRLPSTYICLTFWTVRFGRPRPTPKQDTKGYWTFTECSRNVHWTFTKCLLHVHWMFTGSFGQMIAHTYNHIYGLSVTGELLYSHGNQSNGGHCWLWQGSLYSDDCLNFLERNILNGIFCLPHMPAVVCKHLPIQKTGGL